MYVQQLPNSGTCKKKPAHTTTTPSTQTTSQAPTYWQQPRTPPAVKKNQHPANHRDQHKSGSTKPATKAPIHLQATPAAVHAKQPSAVSAAFDLGSGPTALFAGLLAVAALLAVGGGLRHGRRR